MACCGSPPKATRSRPTILGGPTGPIRYVTPTVHVRGLAVGHGTYVKGTHVQTMIDAGWLVETAEPAAV